MKALLYSILLIVLVCCGSEKQKSLNRYSDTPEFIQIYLDSISEGRFLIAEPNEDFDHHHQPGDNEPLCQFVSGILTKKRCEIYTDCRGEINGRRKLTIFLDKEKVLRHTVEVME
jgi:hypothetical protein